MSQVQRPFPVLTMQTDSLQSLPSFPASRKPGRHGEAEAEVQMERRKENTIKSSLL